jgi:hypothetical protein
MTLASRSSAKAALLKVPAIAKMNTNDLRID